MILKCQNINIRKFKSADANYFCEYATDEELRDNLPYPNRLKHKDDTLGFVREYIKTANELWKEKKEYQLGIEDNKTKKVIGFVCLLKLDWKNKKAEVGYWISMKYRGKGLVKEALNQLLDFAFKELKLNKVYAEANNLNVVSYKLLEKCGFKLEKRIKKDHKIDGKWTDQLFYGITNNKELNLKFRKPKRSEYKEFARVENSEAPQYRAIFTPEECKMLSVGKATERGLISSESKRKYLIATINNKIVGTMRYYLKENGILWISMIQVLPSYQGKGVGSVLLKEIEKIASRLKAKAVALEAQKKAKWAVAFYKANGYKILSQSDIDKKPFTGTLEKPLVKHSYVFGKILK